MLYWLLEKGFTEDQIKQYAKSENYTLEELLRDSNVQIDSVIKHQILFDLYKTKYINRHQQSIWF